MRAIILAAMLSCFAGVASAADPSGWMVQVNSATGQWVAVSGMTFIVPAALRPDGSRASSGIIDTGIGASLAFPGGIGVKAGWAIAPHVENGHTSAHLVYGFTSICGQGIPNGGNRMAGGTVTCTNDTGSVSLTITPQ